ncbi:hypothetical protein MMC22_006566 [Lobaria immixta]|nr:hypothetical protein [Lobaria immixta]
MESQLHPSQLQGAQDVHMPAAAEPGTFPNAEILDRHYKLVHRTPYDAPGFEGAPLANTIVSTAEKPAQPLSSLRSGTNTGVSLHGPFVGHVGYHDITVNEHDGRLPNASFHDAFELHQNSPSLSVVDDFSNTEPHTYASSIIGGNQLNIPGLLPFVPITAASTTSVSQLTSLLGRDQLNAPALLPFVPIAAASTISNPPAWLPSSISPPAPPLQTVTTRALPSRRHACLTCGKTFSRAPDMHRHARKHNPGVQRIDCPSPGCPYTGAKGFLRSDKLASHWQNRHQ